jgi:outer membrane protein OmpA-like peptidoglycan-associated protein
LSGITFAQGVKPVVLISGKALNERNMQPVEAKVVYEILPEGKEAGIARTNPTTGDYKIILPYGKTYGYMALAEGFYSVTKNLDVTNLTKYTEIDEQNLYLAPIEKDQVARLNNVFFEKGTANLKPESYPELNRFVLFLKVNKKIEIEISGHTDNTGDAAKNVILTQNQAQAIADYLIKNGISDKRIKVQGYGSAVPIGFNNSEEGREMNRRIEFKVLSLEKTKK